MLLNLREPPISEFPGVTVKFYEEKQTQEMPRQQHTNIFAVYHFLVQKKNSKTAQNGGKYFVQKKLQYSIRFFQMRLHLLFK